jgi:acetyl-CoA carboxylase biotin carboxyl carrier protein
MKENSNKDIELIRKLSQLMSKEKITKLKYERSDFKLSIDKNTQSENLTTFQTPKLVENEIKENKNIETKTNFDVNHPGALKAPMVGTAYVSPEPGKAPFIRLGDTVSNNQPLLIIEAMKVMNTITAPKGGKVVFIGFEDGQPVEFEQLLVIIE